MRIYFLHICYWLLERLIYEKNFTFTRMWLPAIGHSCTQPTGRSKNIVIHTQTVSLYHNSSVWLYIYIYMGTSVKKKISCFFNYSTKIFDILNKGHFFLLVEDFLMYVRARMCVCNFEYIFYWPIASDMYIITDIC